MDLRSALFGAIFAFFIFIIYLNLNSSSCAISADAIFSPNSESRVIGLIEGAERSIELEMYVFTSEEVAGALADAVSRGVEVRVIMEQRVNSYNQKEIVWALQDGGVDVRWASFDYKLTHTKMMILDGERVFVGSTNFSNSALGNNREMAVLLEGEIVEEFVLAFRRDWNISSEIK